jgi:hypothetical protein
LSSTYGVGNMCSSHGARPTGPTGCHRGTAQTGVRDRRRTARGAHGPQCRR